MYPLYTLAFAAAVAGYAPVAVLRRIARGVPINLRVTTPTGSEK